MEQVSVYLESELSRKTRDAKNILLLSLISLVVPPLFLAAFLYFLFYYNKRKKLRSDQSLSSIFNGMKGKTIKELRSIMKSSNSPEKHVAASIHAHKSMATVLIIIGIVLTMMLVYIGLAYKMGWV